MKSTKTCITLLMTLFLLLHTQTAFAAQSSFSSDAADIAVNNLKSADFISTMAAEAANQVVESAEDSYEAMSLNHSASGHALQSLGTFKTTAYCPCRSCSEGWGRRTSTGAVAQSGHTIAVDPRVIPYGSKVMINGVIYTAEDKGGGVKGNHIDIFFDSHSQSRQYGVRKVEVFLIK